MIGLVKPRYLIPIHGEYRHLVLHRRLALEMGMAEDQVCLADNGTVLEMDECGVRIAGRVPAGNIYVDGLGVGDVGDDVLRDRLALGRDGIVMVTLTLDRRTGMPLAGPDILTRGFVHAEYADGLIEMARGVVYDALEACRAEPVEWTPAGPKIKDMLGRFLYKSTKRRPMIIPVVMEV
jgi:ribonuclease J